MKILLATDGTVNSGAAIDSLNNFNLKTGDEIKVITVIDLAIPLATDVYAGYLPATAEIEADARRNAENELQKIGRQLGEKFAASGASVSTEVLLGSPASRIVETAEAMSADLIIVGSHGYNSLERLLLGSVSDSVVHHAPCSVLVVRTAK